MTNKVIFYMIVLILLVGCVQLTPAGQRVQILTEEQAALVSSCKHLATVSVSSRDALRNAAASMSGDTALMSNRDVGVTQYIKGDVYDCSTQEVRQQRQEPTPQEKANADYLRKSNLCKSKGGVWISAQCVIPIE